MLLNTYASGRLAATVHGPRGTRKVSGPNLVVNVGLNGAVAVNTAEYPGALGEVIRLAVGTSNTPPTPSDTELGNMARNALPTHSVRGAVSLTQRPGWAVATYVETITFEPDGISRNYAEAGAFSTNQVTGAAARMSQRALFRDELGAPTIVTVAGDEYLTVEWTTQLWRNLADQEFQIDVDGVPTAVTLRPHAVTPSTQRGYAWAVTGTQFDGTPYSAAFPSDQQLVAVDANLPSARAVSTTGTREIIPTGIGRVQHVVTIPPTQGNAAGGIGVLRFGGNPGGTGPSLLWRSQMKFDPPLPKDITKELTFTIELQVLAGEPPEE